MSSQTLKICQFKFQQGEKKDIDFDSHACLPAVSFEWSAYAALASQARRTFHAAVRRIS